VIHHILEHDRAFREYVQHFTNGAVMLKEEAATPRTSTGCSPAGSRRTACTPSTPGTTRASRELTAGKREQSGDVSGNQATARTG
jgi:hypothetical protein